MWPCIFKNHHFIVLIYAWFIKYMYIFFFFSEILPQSCLAEIFGHQTELKQKIPKLEWMIRYLTHVKCRGVLANKGYIVCLKRS